MKKTILSLAVAEIIIGCSIKTNAHAATINTTSDTIKNSTTILALQNSGKILSLGSQGDVVKSIQRLLNTVEGYNIQEDGIYGTETYNAIIKYQSKNGLKQDGIVGKETAVKLLNIDAKPKSNIIKSQIKNDEQTEKVINVNEMIKSQLNSKEINSDTNYFIAVSKSKREVYIYHKELDSWVNIKVFPCSIGSPENPTIEGNFYSGLKGKELRINEIHVKYFTQINGNYLFHSVPYNEIGEVIDDCLGEAVSHGCVRLSIDDAKYIHDMIPAQTGIKIIK
ncbi:L,D-transpeptidase family protein [Clostridium chromiireducens]|uniref:Murein L,D-transpeptidase n=1 Tax=Clostridium chromiireducens TaxID=225345 RepID=A0A1V4IKC1_9CLOT|nr:L,D-transpeptidase family protein [Clostridium chromiireducens]OPJ60471.1 putative L,D-transpeptidase YciB precursor [Clostridium chromiireducens]RII35311.1 murein L,D-transpeptidase [Clostridium chromiireducens]